MSRQIWLLRHGDAEDGGPGTSDEARRLTAKGEEQARWAGRAFAALGLTFAHAFTSPRVRGRDTALLACEPLGIEPVVHEPLSKDFAAEDALELLLTAGPREAVLAVGHEPDFSQVVLDLTGARIDLKKGGVAAVRMEGSRDGRLFVLLRPPELERLAG
jgi:phosphohistidine phosphatase